MLSLYTIVILAVAHVNALPISSLPISSAALPTTSSLPACASCVTSTALALPTIATNSVASAAATLPVVPVVAGAASVTGASSTSIAAPASTVSSVNAAVVGKVDATVSTASQVVSAVPATTASIIAKVDPVLNATLAANATVSAPTNAVVNSSTSASGSVSASAVVSPVLAQVTAMVNLLNLCQTMSGSLYGLVGQLGAVSSLAGGLINTNVASAITGLTGFVGVATNSIKTIGTVTDAQLQVTLYAAYKLMANSVLQSCNSVTSQKTLLTTQKVAIHAALLQLQVSIHALTEGLFGGCIPTGLDVTNIRVMLYASLQAAVDATA